MRYYWIWVIVSVITLFSCRKEEDDSEPVIVYLSPAAQSSFVFGDTLVVRISLSDDRQLTRYECQLVNDDLTPVTLMASQNLSSSGTTVEFLWVLQDVHLESGSYFLETKAFDGTNVAKEYLPVQLSGAPRVLLGFFAALPAINNVTIYKSDTTWQPTSFIQYTGDYTDLAVHPRWQQIGVSGKVNGPFRCTSIDGNSSSWSVNPFNGPGDYWGNVIVRNSDWWIAVPGEEKIRGYDRNGGLLFTYTCPSGYKPEQATFSGSTLFTTQRDIASGQRYIITYNATGAIVHQVPLNIEVAQVIPSGPSTVYLLGNSGGQGKLLLYDDASAGIWEPLSLPAAEVLSSCMLDDGSMLIGMSNMNIYRFTYSPLGLLIWNSGVRTDKICYDEAGGTVIVQDGLNVKQYDYPLTAVLQQAVLPDTAADVELWYNK